MSFSNATVVATTPLSTRLVRITLDIEDPDALAVTAAADSAVGVYFPGSDEGRNYSVRAQRGARIDVDVVLHATGPGTTWARQAHPGDRVGLDHARSWYRPPVDTDWQLLVTDLSGLPACARIIENLPAAMPTVVIAEVTAQDDLHYLPQRPNVTLTSSVGTGNGHAPSALATLTRDLTLPAGTGYCWFAGEAAESRAVRKYLRSLGWGIERFDVTGYWRVDSATWDAQFALVSDDVVAIYQQALAAGKSDKVAFEEFDEALERAGL
ncbi:siderophore-interacting protein [Mycolicibacterium tokaiense]|uniref:Siderophore-interacting protein n=1 Tax=Mycolicibacterium tokaiense TaxID=39695 RepID=A0A378T8S7_9MYCO|nr:siderophore-interacting protein [Mycolicibacterium tokaiense]BBY88651.1 siderophore-interacting protein [Mycolicibacterium tokaiense]STZ56824.1 Siderophore-interacting protein [Mycolicibacterium tokaiense]